MSYLDLQPATRCPVLGTMHAVLARLALLPRGVVTLAVVMAAATALVAVCGMVVWMILSPRRARARA